ncbi:TolC family protein [Chitinophaga rhizophila]|uniref:TolC family protein n=1 Tax=Chitinophaga rhizophila TaxID=2866212 RepID=A0ABS7GDI5_9BACT|nr:TolC family protein [Chitinophaga rhizophila]MBW8685735.1 TolC family protein [Chitinophaga rhizophila]
MKRTLLYFSLLLGTAAHAQQILTPDQAIDVALKNNYDIRLAKNDAAITANDFAYANLAFAPRVSGAVNKVWNTTQTKQEFVNGNKRDTSGIRQTSLSGNVTLSWTLFDGLKMFATRQKLESLRDLGEMAVKDQVVNTVANIIAGYYNVVQQKQQLRNISEQLSISEERVKLSDAKFQTGLGPKTDWLQSKVDYNALKASYLRQQTLIEQSKATLNQLMAIEAGNTQYDVLDTIPLNLELSYGGLRQQALQENTGIKVAEQSLKVSQLQLKESKGDFFPIINFNSGYNYNRINSNAATNSFSPVYNQNGVLNYGFSATVPIFNGLNVRRQVNAARLNVGFQRLSLENTRTLVDLSLTTAFKDYEYYKTAVTLEEENLGLARENVMVAMERFRQGVSTVIEMKEAQQSLEDAFNRLINARYNIKLAETELLRLNGMLVK